VQGRQFAPQPQYNDNPARATYYERYEPQPQQQIAPQVERVTTENLYEAAGHWKGGPAAKANPDPCPQCGGNQYFANLQVNKRGPQPAGHCYNCGYNDGMFTQGLASSWGAG